MKRLTLYLSLFFILPFSATAQSPLIQEMVNSVSADSLVATMLRLQGFGTRYEYTPQQDSAGEFLLQEHLRRGVSATAQNYKFGTTGLWDIQFASPDTGWICDAGGMIIKTTNGGASWTDKNTTISVRLICLHFINGSIGWAAGGSGTIIHSTDGGEHWVQQRSGITADINDITFLNEKFGLAVGIGGHILRTENGGLTWDSVGSGTVRNLLSVSLTDSLHAWAVGTLGTILVSTNGGLSWTPQPSGVSASLYAVSFPTPLVGYAAGVSSTLLKTSNGGLSWSRLSFPAAGTIGRVLFTDSLHGWALTRSYKLLRTTDGGVAWDTSLSVLSTGWGPNALGLDVSKTGHLAVCGSRSSVYTSDNDGTTWEERTGNLPHWYLHPSANIVATIPGKINPQREVLVVGHYDSYATGNPYSSAPGANDNASGTSAVMEAARICSHYDFESTLIFLAVSGEELGMMGSYYAATNAAAEGRQIAAVVNGDMIGYPTSADTTRLAISSYLQHNWLIDTAIAVNQHYDIGLTLMTAVDSTGASDYGPYAQVGYDALEIEEDLPDAIWGGADPYYHTTLDLVANLRPGLVRRGAQLMLAVAAEVARPIGVTSVEQIADKPENFALMQNFPNPFNPSTVIEYTVGGVRGQGLALSDPAEGGRVEGSGVSVKLTVYDLLGREVAVLVNERQAPGRYTVRFDGTGLASGVYFYKLTAGSFTEAKRMVLLR